MKICAVLKRRSEVDIEGFFSLLTRHWFHSFRANPISITVDPKAGSMLDTTFVKVMCWYSSE